MSAEANGKVTYIDEWVARQDAAAEAEAFKHPSKLGKAAKYFMGIAAVTGAVAFGAIELSKGNSGITKYERGKAAEAVKGIDTVRSSIVVLNSGTKYRLSPAVENGSAADDMPNNVVGEVPAGKQVKVDYPMESSNFPGWIAYLKPGVDPSSIKSLSDREKNTVWTDLSAVEQQHNATEAPGVIANASGVADIKLKSDGRWAFADGNPFKAVESDFQIGSAIEEPAGKPIGAVNTFTNWGEDQNGNVYQVPSGGQPPNGGA